MIIAGTGPFASAGVTTTIWISTLICGSDELSTRPTNRFPITGCAPTISRTVFSTVHVTEGTSFGTRPMTSRSKSSTISGRRCFHHISGVVTLSPFFSVSASGRFGNGLALDSS